MKKGQKPTRRQKIAIQAAGLNYDYWLVYKNIEGNLHLVHRETGTKKVILS